MAIGNTRTDKLFAAALTGLATRQRVISNNVANVDTPDFKASTVSFEQALRRASSRDDGGFRMFSVANAVAGPDDAPAEAEATVTVLADTTRRRDGNNVDIDQEMVELAETNITYNALAQLTSSRLQVLRTIVNDGRR